MWGIGASIESRVGYVILGVLVACCAYASSAAAYTIEPTKGDICGEEVGAIRGAMERSLEREGPTGEWESLAATSVMQGTPATLSIWAPVPPTFALASSEARLGNPNIDSGVGSLQMPEGDSTDGLYTFTSTKATATTGVVYWDVSFSLAGFTECEGSEPYTFSQVSYPWSAPHPLTLTVVAKPSEPSAEAKAEPKVIRPPSLTVRITRARSFTMRHPVVAYRVSCSIACAGSTSYRVVVKRGHAKESVSRSIGPVAVAIDGSSGGQEQFSHHYAGKVLRTLDGLIRSGDTVTLAITVKIGAATVHDDLPMT